VRIDSPRHVFFGVNVANEGTKRMSRQTFPADDAIRRAIHEAATRSRVDLGSGLALDARVETLVAPSVSPISTQFQTQT
jgi:hypothetical protein